MTDREDHSREYEINSHRAHLSGFVLVAGLVLELINAVIWYKGPETLAEMAAVVLIVGGVWGEIFFGHKARLHGDKQLAHYEANTREAEARAAEAHVELARLERKMTPRSITVDGEAAIVEALKSFPSIPFSVVADPAAEYAFINRLIAVLQRAGWIWKEYTVVPRSLPTGHIPGLAPDDDPHVSGVQIRINRARMGDFEEAARALASVLAQTLKAGVAMGADPPESARACSPDTVHIEIARKL
jgi:hypothetical protein